MNTYFYCRGDLCHRGIKLRACSHQDASTASTDVVGEGVLFRLELKMQDSCDRELCAKVFSSKGSGQMAGQM